MRGGSEIRFTSAFDGREIPAYRAAPTDARRGGLVLIQEIFGVTDHIRALADRYAELGYETVAPAFFDREAPGFESGYAPDEIKRAVALSEAAPWDRVAGDIEGAVRILSPPVFAVGFCWGGTAAWLAACRTPGLVASASYYGRRIPELLGERPRCPVIFHFGRRDASIPPEVVEQIREAVPEAPVHVYEAGHGFVSDRSRDHDEAAAHLAELRTLQFLQRAGEPRAEA